MDAKNTTSRLRKNITLKSASLAVAGLLAIGAPSGAVLAHGNRHWWNDDNSRRTAQAEHQWDNDWRERSNDNEDADSESCEQRQAAVDQRIARFRERKQASLDRLSAYLTDQRTFVEQNALDVEDYDRLNERAVNAQERLTDEINELEAPAVDCDRSEKHDRKLVKRAVHDVKAAEAILIIRTRQLSAAIISSL